MGHGMVVLLVMATLGQSGLNVEVLDQYLFAVPDAGQVRRALTKRGHARARTGHLLPGRYISSHGVVTILTPLGSGDDAPSSRLG